MSGDHQGVGDQIDGGDRGEERDLGGRRHHRPDGAELPVRRARGEAETVLHDLVEHIDAEEKEQALPGEEHHKGGAPDPDGDEHDGDEEGPARRPRDPGLHEGELKDMEDLLPDGRDGTALKPWDRLHGSYHVEEGRQTLPGTI